MPCFTEDRGATASHVAVLSGRSFIVAEAVSFLTLSCVFAITADADAVDIRDDTLLEY
jgi:hypothetical protein